MRAFLLGLVVGLRVRAGRVARRLADRLDRSPVPAVGPEVPTVPVAAPDQPASNWWQTVAVSCADHAVRELGHVPRGAWCVPFLGYCYLFGQDGYCNPSGDQRARMEYEELCRRLSDAGLPVLGSATSSLKGGWTWAVVVPCADLAFLNSLVWDCWAWANGLPPALCDPQGRTLALQATSAYRGECSTVN